MVICPENKILNPKSGRCVLRSGTIGRSLIQKLSTQNIKYDVRCPNNMIKNPRTGRCVLKSGRIGRMIIKSNNLISNDSRVDKKCPSNKIRNPRTGRCVLRSGKIGQSIKHYQKHGTKRRPKHRNKDTGLCSFQGVEQCHNSCFYVSVMLLLLKLKFIYDVLDEPSRKYVDSIRKCPRIDTDMCSRLPHHIQKEYGRKIDIVNRGGYAYEFFKAILNSNNIPYKWVTKKSKNLIVPYVHNSFDLVIVQSNFPENMDYPSIKKELENVKTNRNKTIHVGGIIKVERIVDGSHRYHSISYTVCEGSIITCTWGICSSSETGEDLYLESYK